MNDRRPSSLAAAACLVAMLLAVVSSAGLHAQRSKLTPSPDGTQVPPATSIVDSSLATWTIASDGRILRNGAQAAGGWGSIISWSGGTIAVLGTDARWYQWTGSGWKTTTTTQPTAQPSPSGTRVPPAPAIIDNALSSWTIAADRAIRKDGVQVAGGYGSIIDWTNNVISVFGTDSRWYTWTGSRWVATTTTTPTTPTATPSANLTEIPPATTIVDHNLAAWTIASDLRILRDGTHAAGGYGSAMLWYGGGIYVLGTDQRWYQWTGSSWVYFSQSKPGGTTTSPPAGGGGTVTGDFYVAPGQNIQSVLDAGPEGSTIVLQAGTHRLQSLRPRNGQTIVGASGAVLSGARQLTTFGRSGAAWVATGQTQEGAGVGECQSWAPRCVRPEDLFIDDARLLHVASLSEGGSGRWFFDYAADTIYFWDDPAGRRVEASITPYAIGGTASNVTVKSLVIEKYANPAQTGVIRGGGLNWLIDSNLVRFNHGSGIEMASGRQVLRNTVYANGQMGVSGSAIGALVEANEISYNNAAGYNAYWEGGGTKFANCSSLIIRGNFVHHNDGPGLHTDINNIDVLIENNRVEDNALTGIFHEVSYRTTIRYNTASRNGQKRPDPYWVDGAGILVNSSPDVEIYGNTLVDNWQGITALQTNRGSGTQGAFILKNLNVHDNEITQTGTTAAGSGRTGLEDLTGTAAFTSNNNRFVNNHYHLGSSAQYFFWLHVNVDEWGWRGYGQDVNGTFGR